MTAEPDKFISQEITVTRDKDSGHPCWFDWDGRRYQVRDVIAVWPDYGFSAGAPSKKNWRMRRHRNWYRVETSDGAVYEMYHDRGLKPGEGRWFLYARFE